MGELIFMVFLGFIGFKIIKSVAGKKSASAWELAGLDLGLFYEPGGLMRGPQLHGVLNGVRVAVDTLSKTSGNRSTTYTRYLVYYTEPLGLGLSLTRQGALSAVATFFGAQDLELGDPNFDKHVVVKTRHPEGTRDFLNPDRRYRIWRALNTWSQLQLEDDQIRLETNGRERDQNKLCGTVRQLVELAGAMSHTLPPQAHTVRLSSLTPPLPSAPPPPRFDDPLPARPPPPPAAEPVPPAAKPQREGPEPIPPPSEPPIQSTPLPAPPSPAGPALEPLCAELFKPNQSGTEAERLFGDRYRNQRVCWQAELRSVQRISYHVIFGDRPITKADFDTIEVNTKTYGARRIQVVAAFPEDMLMDLQHHTGQTVSFEGTLVRVDGLMRSLYVADARLNGDVS